MGRTPDKTKAKQTNLALAREGKPKKAQNLLKNALEELEEKNVENEKLMTELAEKKEEKEKLMMELEEKKEEIGMWMEELDEKKKEIGMLMEELDEKKKEMEKYEKEIRESEKKAKDAINNMNQKQFELELTVKRLEARDNQIFSLRQKTSKLESVITEIKAEKVIFQNEHRILEKKYFDLEQKKKNLVSECPSGGSNLKPFDSSLTQNAKNNRCRKILESIKKSVGEEKYNAVITELCHYISKDKELSFKLTLTEFESYMACIKWKMTDGFLKEFKSFLTQKLGFDVFAPRYKIEEIRKQYSAIDKYDISIETIVRKVGGKRVEVDSAVIQANNVESLLISRLENLHSNGQIEFKNPTDPVVIGIGADKGGIHTKIVIVMGNVPTPNNPHSLLLVGMYEGSDDYESLQKFMSPVFDQINSLSHITYLESGVPVKRILQKLLIGDCKLISAVMGHSGQSCSTPCFLCKLTWVNHGGNTARVENFPFSTIGGPYDSSDLKDPLLAIHPSAVGPPGVHTLLGVTQSYVLDWLVALCNCIDSTEDLPEDLKRQKKVLRNLLDEQQYYEERFDVLQKANENIRNVCEVVEKVEISGNRNYGHLKPCDSSLCVVSSSKKKLFGKQELFKCIDCKKYIHTICSFLVTSDSDLLTEASCVDCQNGLEMTVDERKQHLHNMLKHIEMKIVNDSDVLNHVKAEKKSVEKAVNTCQGATRKKLEAVLQKVGCDLRTWYQKLTGNQVRRLLRPENIKQIMGIFPPESSDNIDLMETVMICLGKIMSSSNNQDKTDAEIEELQKTIEIFEGALRQAQPHATVTPKLHLLTAHLIPYLRLHRSWGRVTEQGLEHLHVIINSANARLAPVLDPKHKAKLIVQMMSNFNQIFDLGHSWYRSQ